MPRRITRLPEAAFRPEFIQSLDAFLRHAADDDPFNLEGRDRPLKVSSVATYRDRLLRFASLLVLAGRDISSLRSLHELVLVDVVKLGPRHLLQRGQREPKMLASLDLCHSDLRPLTVVVQPWHGAATCVLASGRCLELCTVTTSH